MIPLRDKVRVRRLPLVTVLLIIANIYVFLKEILLGPELKDVIFKFAVIPAAYLHPGAWTVSQAIANSISLVSSLFLHGGWFHLLGNMWYLWIFGDNVEDKLGHFRFLVFYILCGLVGNWAHIVTNIHSNSPALGASGCISGVLGAYLLLFPRAKIITLLPLFIFWTVAEIPAFFFLGFWFLIQFLNGFFTLPGSKESTGNVAWWAHIGGFTAGFLSAYFFRIRKR
ncbi:MAG: rhomboid family intramembrane serine protease [Candidatus Omnitrophica bacterium]|nr:rhomboid family intramembrane serine protease [Candidatus Omnitrophota bacterium]